MIYTVFAAKFLKYIVWLTTTLTRHCAKNEVACTLCCRFIGIMAWDLSLFPDFLRNKITRLGPNFPLLLGLDDVLTNFLTKVLTNFLINVLMIVFDEVFDKFFDEFWFFYVYNVLCIIICKTVYRMLFCEPLHSIVKTVAENWDIKAPSVGTILD